MRSRFGYGVAVATMMMLSLDLVGCGDDAVEPAPPPPPTDIVITVRSRADSSRIEYSNVVLYDAETREAVLRGMTNSEGVVSFRYRAGDFYLDISAQGFDEVPPPNIAAVPFFSAAGATTVKTIYLDAIEGSGDAGFIVGFVQPAINNFLILVESQSNGQKYFTTSGPDGVFVVYNLPYDGYDLNALKSGFGMSGPSSASLTSTAPVDTVHVGVTEYAGSSLEGAVTFLASENSVVDITLLDPDTRAVVPGLAVLNEASGLTYSIRDIPDGDYVAWASMANDGYVIDPDWLFKNPGGLDVSFTSPVTSELNFSVTDAITLRSPTNPAEATIPAMASAAVPTFRWDAYPSAKEYFIEVRDINGKLLWGGFNSDGTTNHAFIGANVTSVEYNFDAQLDVPALEPGGIYRWQVWADLGTQADSFVEQLISASEDLRGLFEIPEDPAPE